MRIAWGRGEERGNQLKEVTIILCMSQTVTREWQSRLLLANRSVEVFPGANSVLPAR